MSIAPFQLRCTRGHEAGSTCTSLLLRRLSLRVVLESLPDEMWVVGCMCSSNLRWSMSLPHLSTWDRGFPPQILLRISRSVGIPLEEEHVTHPRDRRGARGATSIEPIPQRTLSSTFAPLRTMAPAPGRIVLDRHRIPKGDRLDRWILSSFRFGTGCVEDLPSNRPWVLGSG